MYEVMVPSLRALKNGAENARTALPFMREQFGLTDEEMAETIPSGQRTRIFDRVDWAIFHLMHAGLVYRPNRGVYRVSDDGAKVLAEGVSLDLNALKEMPKYQEWIAAQKQDKAANSQDHVAEAFEDSDLPPDEVIETAHKALSQALTDQLLDLARSFSSTPDRFEQLIVDLLIAMGYGGGDPSMGERLGKSGDGGIDGIVNEDRLGLDAVYLQAKCYAEGNTIGRPAIQQFIGSLTGEGATKGVFVTTSAFSKEARDYAEKVQQRIVLIDGSELARLMIQYGVGVRTRRTYEVKSVDEDYFAPPEGL